MEINRAHDLAVELALHVGKRIRDSHSSATRPTVRYKSHNDPVTEVDEWADAEIRSRVKQEFPDHLYVGEESEGEILKQAGKSLEEYTANSICWIVDPIDGTTNFTRCVPNSAVSIGILKNGKAVVGVIYDPFRDELFTAKAGHGAQLNGNKINVSSLPKLADALIAVGFPPGCFKSPALERYYLPLMSQAGGIRVFGAAAIDICWVACGRYDAFYQQALKPWDVAAGALIVEEAGGKAWSVDGEYSPFGKGFVFSNRAILPELKQNLKI